MPILILIKIHQLAFWFNKNLSSSITITIARQNIQITRYFYSRLNILKRILLENNKTFTNYYYLIIINHITHINFLSFAKIIRLKR